MSMRNADRQSAAESLPIVLVAGLPGAGKTSLALHVHRHCGGRIAVVEGEHMGTQDIVGLARALADRHHDAMVMELPATIDAAEIASSLEESGATSLRSVVTVLDAHTFLRDFCSKGLLSERCETGSSSEDARPIADVLTEQIELANVVVINKLDLVPVENKPGLRALVTALNPSATILDCVRGRVVPSEIMEAREFKVAQAHDSTGWALTLADTPIPNARQHGISTLLYRERRPFHPARFAQLLSDAWPGVVRAKGVFWVATRPDWAAELSQAGAARRYRAVTSWWAATLQGKTFEPHEIETFLGIPWDPTYGDRRQELAFVGLDFDPEALKQRLDACLLDDIELRRGAEVWQTYPDPFPPWGLVATTRHAARYN
jgi:G3E family GTPase